MCRLHEEGAHGRRLQSPPDRQEWGKLLKDLNLNLRQSQGSSRGGRGGGRGGNQGGGSGGGTGQQQN